MGAEPVTARAVGGRAAGAQGADERRRLREVCQEFEAFLVKEIFKELRKSTVFGGGADERRPAGSDIQTGMADDRFAEWISRSGGLGLGKMLFDSLAEQAGGCDQSSD